MCLGGTTGDNTRLFGQALEEEEVEMQAEGVREVAVASGLDVLYQETPNYRGAAAEADRMIEPRETARHAWRVQDLGVREPVLSADVIVLVMCVKWGATVRSVEDVKSNLRSVASASGAVPPPLFHGCTVPQLPTFTTSLATVATNVTAAAVTTSSRSRGGSGRRGGQGAGGGGVANGGGGRTEVGGATRAATSDSPAAAGGGDARVRQALASPPAAGAGVAAWYLAQRQQ
ncbi:unnamed protein product [Closterium sp. NIES-53]